MLFRDEDEKLEKCDIYQECRTQSKLNEVSLQLSQVITHVGFQTTPDESGSGQIPDASSMYQRRLSINNEL
ncbi:hypothetical protein Pyn_32144 [Prunus yedoensis var. nudiflora]|uniref:Uncharacterized protein n=1 Tax=Prunus yedoensis var. nudiflora TaxID=2094558 RepID=A0A315A018_PRUYE|nr:hypothetical protein Pyn_32144 [Prunus yedoensis var. nudiflora]